jgi:alanine dehydrogenase
MMETILYLSRDDVRKLLPPIEEQLDITARTYLAMAAGTVELPPKPAVYPREDSFLHAMPVYHADADVVAVKWIGGSSSNKSRGLPYLSGLIIVSDPETARPIAVMDAAEITAARTASASGVCIRRFAAEGWSKVALIGFGEQGRAHARMLVAMNPDVSLVVYQRQPSPESDYNGRVARAPDPDAAVLEADIVVTGIPLAKNPRPILTRESVKEPALLLPLDFDASLQGSLVKDANLFVVDDVDQFEYYRGLGHFIDWPPPDDSIGQALSTQQRPTRAVCCNLGVAALDAAFAAFVLERAREQVIGIRLPS